MDHGPIETVMNLTFCDLCNESIPQADLDMGRAVRRNERWICAACEAAMTSSRPAPLPAPSAPPPAARAHAVHSHEPASSSPVIAIALAFSGVALLAAAGSAAFLFVQIDRTRDGLEQRIEDGQRRSFERERTLLATLEDGASDRASGLELAREDVRTLEARILELEREGGDARALARRIEALEEQLTAKDSSLAVLEGQTEELNALRTAVARLQEGETSAPAPPPEKRAPVEKPVTEPASAADSAPAEAQKSEPPRWQSWLTDLASQDSGTRWQAVQSLGGTRDPAVVPHLIPVLGDADIFVRMATARILGDLGSATAIPALIDALEDEEASVRDAVLVSLRGLSGQNIPFDPNAREAERQKRVKAWRDWWDQAAKQLLGDKKARG